MLLIGLPQPRSTSGVIPNAEHLQCLCCRCSPVWLTRVGYWCVGICEGILYDAGKEGWKEECRCRA